MVDYKREETCCLYGDDKEKRKEVLKDAKKQAKREWLDEYCYDGSMMDFSVRLLIEELQKLYGVAAKREFTVGPPKVEGKWNNHIWPDQIDKRVLRLLHHVVEVNRILKNPEKAKTEVKKTEYLFSSTQGG